MVMVMNFIERTTNFLKLPLGTPKLGIKFTGNDTIAEKMWYIALEDIEKNYCIDTEYGVVFAAGGYNEHKNWDGLTFNRDTSYSGLLALNSIYPNEMLTSIKAIRKYREKLKFTCTPDTKLEGIDGVDVLDVDSLEFRKIFHKGTAINKTDDVVWIWCAYDLIKKNQFDEWEWFYETACDNFKNFYFPFFDKKDGLFFGQPTFIDVGLYGYPEHFGYNTKEARNNGVWVKATSTNALYYKALSIMSEVAEMLGLNDEAKEWELRAKNLKGAILKHLRFEDGTFAYFKHKDGSLEDRHEALGTAFAVLLDIVEGEDAKHALSGCGFTQYGVPLIYPFYENGNSLHNNATWPFVDTFYLLALEKAYGDSFVAHNLMVMLNASIDGHIYEYRDTNLNHIRGAKAQLWSIAGFINTCIRGGLTELPTDFVKIK